MPQEQFQRVKQNQNPTPSSQEDRESTVTAYTRNDAIRNQTQEAGKDLREQGALSQAVVRIVNEAARDQEGNGDAGGSRTPQK